MASHSDLQLPLEPSVMNRNDVESQNSDAPEFDRAQIQRAKFYTRCFRIFATIIIIGLLTWLISILVRQKYKVKTPIDKPTNVPERLILRAMLYSNDLSEFSRSVSSLTSLSITGEANTYIKYFAKNGENPMHCKGSYCWRWQTPNRVVCSVRNNAKPWNPNAAWMCEAQCPDDYDLDTVQITCSSDSSVATNPHLGCSLVYSMKYSGYTMNIDWEYLGQVIVMIVICTICFIFLIICVAAIPQPSYNSNYSYSRNSGPDACDLLICLALLNSCNNKGGGGGRGGHYSSTWG